MMNEPQRLRFTPGNGLLLARTHSTAEVSGTRVIYCATPPLDLDRLAAIIETPTIDEAFFRAVIALFLSQSQRQDFVAFAQGRSGTSVVVGGDARIGYRADDQDFLLDASTAFVPLGQPLPGTTTDIWSGARSSSPYFLADGVVPAGGWSMALSLVDVSAPVSSAPVPSAPVLAPPVLSRHVDGAERAETGSTTPAVPAPITAANSMNVTAGDTSQFDISIDPPAATGPTARDSAATDPAALISSVLSEHATTGIAVKQESGRAPTLEPIANENSVISAHINNTQPVVSNSPVAAGAPASEPPTHDQAGHHGDRHEQHDDQIDEGLTIWPVLGRTSTPAPFNAANTIVVSPADMQAIADQVDVGSVNSMRADHRLDRDSVGVDRDALVDGSPENGSQENAVLPSIQPAANVEVVSTVETNASAVWQPPSWSADDDATIAPMVQELPVAADTAISTQWRPPTDSPRPDDADRTVFGDELERLGFNRVSVPVSPHATTALLAGAICEQGHFTDATRSCLFCGSAIDWQRGVVHAERPTLGTLEFSDGQQIEVHVSVLIGRKPGESDATKQTVAFIDDNMLSRIHVEIRAEDWNIVAIDRQSANGTDVVEPHGQTHKLKANVGHTLSDGDVIRFGRESAVFRSAVNENVRPELPRQ